MSCGVCSVQSSELTAPYSDFADPEQAHRCGEFVGFVLEELKEVLNSPEEDPRWRENWWEDYLSRRDKVE